jgi:uncharacterized protein YgbK (DUF1537 family)
MVMVHLHGLLLLNKLNDMDQNTEINEWLKNGPEQRLLDEIREINRKHDHIFVVLDDDPTGTQTMHDVPVVTTWSIEQLTDLFNEKCPVFYILTNSRSLSPEEAGNLVKNIARNLEEVSDKTNRNYNLILRSDSTLRGHHPEEMNAVLDILNYEPDLKIIYPAFIEGGRYTFKSIHYAKEGNRYIPCGETQFARDPSFGYNSSNLCDWIIEKTNGSVSTDQITSVTLDVLREESLDELTQRIRRIDKGNYLISDALTYSDIDKFCLALLRSQRSFIARTGASFVASVSGIEPREILTYDELKYKSENGGMIIAGSYVGKTTRQMNSLIEHTDIVEKVVDVKKLLKRKDTNDYLHELSDSIQTLLLNKEDVLIYTSREVVTADDIEDNLDIGKRISTFISDLVGSLSVTPSYLIAKGGITSSDIATKSLAVKKARIIGQILPGIPVWELGKESKYPGMPYVIFPGNVGDDKALLSAYERIKGIK